MKIIKEIEKSRLTENGMKGIKGGATNPGDQCSEEVTYRSCGSIGNIHFNVVPYWFGTHFLKIAFMNKIDSKLSKRVLLVAIICFSIVNISFAQSKGGVDERFELTSIVFRLTDDIAFVHSTPANYIADIDEYFSPYKNHELIEFVKKTMYSKSILDISLPVELASDIKITSDSIMWTNDWTPLFVQHDTLPVKRIWTRSEREEYLCLLNKFYKDTHFHKFYSSHADFYAAIESAFDSIISKIDTSWFLNFFGIPYQMDNIWLVPANGYHNFAIHRSDRNFCKYNNCALGGVLIDSIGNPYLHKNVFMVLIHEICHNYSNPMCAKYDTMFADICDTLFFKVSDKLKKSYYSLPSAILYEGTNRLCEFSYYVSQNIYNDIEIKEKIRTQIYDGFIWFEDMLRYMNVFYANREKYITFETFIPQLKLFLEQVVENMEHYYFPKYDMLIPRVVATYPAMNSVVETNLNEVRIQFSKPMQHLRGILKVDVEDVSFPPVVDWRSMYWENDYVYVIPLKEPLKQNTKYGLKITSDFADALDYFGAIPYDLIFETKR